jgi:hypothetical protein
VPRVAGVEQRMRKNRLSLAAGCAFAIATGSGIAAAQTAPSGATLGAAATVYPDTREYVWTFLVPVLSTERVDVVTKVKTPSLRGRRWDYESPTLKSQRFKLGQVAEFSCKYIDLQLPQECRTEWRNVYADLPVLAMEHNHIDYDAVEWREEEHRIRIDLPRWTWSERTLTISVPILTAEDQARAQATLDVERASAAKTIDAGIAELETSIAAVEAQGADPRKLPTGDGSIVDLQAMRQTLRDERKSQLEQWARVRGDLESLVARGLDAGRTSTLAP